MSSLACGGSVTYSALRWILSAMSLHVASFESPRMKLGLPRHGRNSTRRCIEITGLHGFGLSKDGLHSKVVSPQLNHWYSSICKLHKPEALRQPELHLTIFWFSPLPSLAFMHYLRSDAQSRGGLTGTARPGGSGSKAISALHRTPPDNKCFTNHGWQVSMHVRDCGPCRISRSKRPPN